LLVTKLFWRLGVPDVDLCLIDRTLSHASHKAIVCTQEVRHAVILVTIDNVLKEKFFRIVWREKFVLNRPVLLNVGISLKLLEVLVAGYDEDFSSV
jgi:hypothetical protein